jgi:hypothetical protein
MPFENDHGKRLGEVHSLILFIYLFIYLITELRQWARYTR